MKWLFCLLMVALFAGCVETKADSIDMLGPAEAGSVRLANAANFIVYGVSCAPDSHGIHICLLHVKNGFGGTSVLYFRCHGAHCSPMPPGAVP